MEKSALEGEMLRQFARFQHPDKVFNYFPGWDDAALAAIAGVNPQALQGVRAELRAEARRAASDLLADPTLAARVDRLPFREGDVVVCVGDSYTDDITGWAEILRHMLDLRRPSLGVTIVNEGISGQTTTQALRRVPGILGLRPAWILTLIGGNDAVRLGPDASFTQVSIAETERNLAALRALAPARSRWVWLTLPQIDEKRIAAYVPFLLGQATWRDADVQAISAAVRRQADAAAETVVEVEAVFDVVGGPELMGPDGLHPSVHGQQVIARAVIEALT
jgi:lysophospholipase L1-like esterase